ncbi:Abi-like protein [Sphingomonas sp. PP-F2F-A104-K0414]|uniref:Abi family protein n=1 Tax=Sphingomonas sp. PP-F2F-A104-K0414 TaxID=2135661 RepID=UPI0010486CF4|nr:Abi family protein [Sphingomonas sp. PP-F2F-A104-K0414]TCP96418.1 Abi-like protein [Sphingomonas sp. PP-F2F-A104-K0414]
MPMDFAALEGVAPGEAYLPRGPLPTLCGIGCYENCSGREMAESQEFAALTPQTIKAVELALSKPRFSAYLGSHGDHEYALRLYLWNGRLSKAFLFPLGVCEIATRNAINGALSGVYGPNWVLAPPFGLNVFSAQSHTRALDRLTRAAQNRGLPPPGSNDLVAALTFDFWSNLFRDDYDHVWTQPVLAAAFPHLPAGFRRKDVQKQAAEINDLRNRIAHHEPIHDRQNHGAKLARILDLIGMSSRTVRDFTRRHSTVMMVSRTPPTLHSRFPGRPLAQMNLRPPPVVAAKDTLDIVLPVMRAARPELAMIAGAGAEGVLTTTSAMALTADRAAMTAGMVDLTDLTARDVVNLHPLSFAEIDVRATSGDVLALFFPSDSSALKPAVVIVRSVVGHVAGVLIRPEVRL